MQSAVLVSTPPLAFAVGDRVRSPSRPDWGAGRVTRAAAAGRIGVLFREAGELTLSLAHAKLEWLGDGERSDAWLERLSLAPVAPGAAHVSPRAAMARFLEAYPDGFRDERYRSGERAALESAQAILREALSRDALRTAVRGRRWGPCCAAATRALSVAKIVSPADAALLRQALATPSARGPFVTALNELFHGRQPAVARFERFAGALEAIGAPRWGLVTFFGFARCPEQHMFLRQGETPLAASALRFDLGFRPEPNAATYARLLELALCLEAELGALGPEDRFDLQALLRSIARGA